MKTASTTTGKSGKSGATPMTPAKARKGSGPTEAMLARVESARLEQRQNGHFDCFARALSGFCDQGECMYRDECLAISGRMA